MKLDTMPTTGLLMMRAILQGDGNRISSCRSNSCIATSVLEERTLHVQRGLCRFALQGLMNCGAAHLRALSCAVGRPMMRGEQL